jgi:glycerophosphoryl diester phosphodiesterase
MRIVLTIDLALLTIWTAAMAGEPVKFFEPLEPPRSFQLMVPGGMAEQAPANTRPAIVMAIEDSLEWIELPLRRTEDGQHIAFGAERLEGMSNGTGPIGDQTAEQLGKLDCGSWFARRFAGTKLLTLADCLALAKGKINLCLDCQDVDPQRLAGEITSAGAERQVLVTGAPKVLERVRAASDGKVAIMAAWQPAAGWAGVESLHPALVDVEADYATSELCRDLHARGVKVRARTSGTADRADVWDTVLAAGADFVRTSLAEEVIAHVLDAKLRPRPVRFACHRGASRYAAENTLLAFEKAYRLRADFVEFDVRPSRDGDFFLLHDAKLDRTTNGKGPIREATSAAIALLDAGSWFGGRSAGARVPSLDDFLKSVPREVSLYFDAKDIPPEALAAALSRHGLVERTIVYQSADYLERLKAVDSRIRAMPPAGSMADVKALAAGLRPYAVDSRWTALSKQYIDYCHAAGIQVFADAPFGTPVKGYQQAIDWGIDLIQTDYPLRAWRAMELAQTERIGK